jgi:hypothetical protein
MAAVLGVLAPPMMARGGEDEHSAQVTVARAPDGGIQPQAVSDGEGAIHLLTFRGDPAGGDLFYARTTPGREGFSRPIRVNSQPGSAIAIGSIRGGQLAIGKGGRVHVAWNGSMKALPKNPFGASPMLYARSDAGRSAFEPQRNLMTRTSALDGGGTVAADGAGNVYVAWHARSEDAPAGEVGRRVWVARSADDGASFAPEEPAPDEPTGACGCCGTRALAGDGGTFYMLYRAARDGVGRDMVLLTSRDRGAHFRGATLHPWKLDGCPMSLPALARAGRGVLAAWETKGQVYFATIDPETGRWSPPASPPGGRGDRKLPVVAANARGEAILAWAEGTGWQRGGDLAWQVFDRDGRPTDRRGRVEGGIPVWSLPAVVARPDGGFTIIH